MVPKILVKFEWRHPKAGGRLLTRNISKTVQGRSVVSIKGKSLVAYALSNNNIAIASDLE